MTLPPSSTASINHTSPSNAKFEGIYGIQTLDGDRDCFDVSRTLVPSRTRIRETSKNIKYIIDQHLGSFKPPKKLLSGLCDFWDHSLRTRYNPGECEFCDRDLKIKRDSSLLL